MGGRGVVGVEGTRAMRGRSRPALRAARSRYEVVWRDSTDTLWTHSRQVGNVTTATIENLNKDNVQIGVRAIDNDGNRSPVATP